VQPSKTVIAMVGLPARGKSYIARKIARYLSWRGQPSRVFNVGRYRRELVGAQKSPDFFDPDNAEGRRARMEMARLVLDEALDWLGREGEVAVFDATNTTRARRHMIAHRCDQAGVDLSFFEVICDDEPTVEDNIRGTKLNLPDFAGMSAEQAMGDFKARIAHYRRAYEPIDDEGLSWVKLVVLPGGGRRVVINRVEAETPLRAAQLAVGFHAGERTIWLTRHGESTHNVAGRIGGDAPLSPRGVAFARNLQRHLTELDSAVFPKVWTSTLLRTRQTAELVGARHTPWHALDEIDAGICDGMTYEEIARDMPDEFQARQADKLRYRYPRGESYLDLIARLDPLIAELERADAPLLVIAHQAVLRALYAYLTGHPREECPFLEVPLHTLIELSPGGLDGTERRLHLGP
jgi:broad specificity phosphatase PhoE/predicted kinase